MLAAQRRRRRVRRVVTRVTARKLIKLTNWVKYYFRKRENRLLAKPEALQTY